MILSRIIEEKRRAIEESKRVKPQDELIKDLKNTIKPEQEIINKVFAREFKFDLEKSSDGQPKTYYQTSHSISAIS